MNPYSYVPVWAVFALVAFLIAERAAREPSNLYKTTGKALLFVVFLATSAAFYLGTPTCLERSGGRNSTPG